MDQSNLTISKAKNEILKLEHQLDVLATKKNINFSNNCNILTVTDGLINLPKEIVNRTIIHSDRGSQFTSNNYKNLLEYFGVTQSMLLSANPKDNAVIESFFGYMKDEIYNTNRK